MCPRRYYRAFRLTALSTRSISASSRSLKRGLNSEGFLTQIALRKLSELYEMWSIFKITRFLLVSLRQVGYEVISDQGFFRLDDE